MERRGRFARARRLLLDPASTAFVLVLIPEKLPILESRKALETLSGHRVPVAGLVVNRVLPPDLPGAFLESRRAQEAEYLRQIDREFKALPRIRVPLLPRDVEGLEALAEMGSLLVGRSGQG
jgi:arsenite/tail-anchored protein-transporting ATPase